jgi:hypothetical protein
MGVFKAQFKAKVEPHGAVMVRVFPPADWQPKIKTGGKEPRIFQAEEADLSGGVAVSTDNEGYSGCGFVQGYYSGSGQKTAFKIEMEKGGRYKSIIRYANAFAGVQALSLYVNGKFIKKLRFKPTGDWESWQEYRAGITMPKGKNTVVLQKDAGDGCVNLDCIKIYDK